VVSRAGEGRRLVAGSAAFCVGEDRRSSLRWVVRPCLAGDPAAGGTHQMRKGARNGVRDRLAPNGGLSVDGEERRDRSTQKRHSLGGLLVREVKAGQVQRDVTSTGDSVGSDHGPSGARGRRHGTRVLNTVGPGQRIHLPERHARHPDCRRRAPPTSPAASPACRRGSTPTLPITGVPVHLPTPRLPDVIETRDKVMRIGRTRKRHQRAREPDGRRMVGREMRGTGLLRAAHRLLRRNCRTLTATT